MQYLVWFLVLRGTPRRSARSAMPPIRACPATKKSRKGNGRTHGGCIRRSDKRLTGKHLTAKSCIAQHVIVESFERGAPRTGTVGSYVQYTGCRTKWQARRCVVARTVAAPERVSGVQVGCRIIGGRAWAWRTQAHGHFARPAPLADDTLRRQDGLRTKMFCSRSARTTASGLGRSYAHPGLPDRQKWPCSGPGRVPGMAIPMYTLRARCSDFEGGHSQDDHRPALQVMLGMSTLMPYPW